jgi:Spy/CpxP family protein refolding chaperone
VKPAVRRAAPAFALGLALGEALGSWGQRALFRRAFRRPPDPQRMIDRLARRLNLDAAQKAGVSRAFAAHRADVEALKASAFSRFEAIRDATNADILKVLTPAQAEKFGRMIARRKERLRKRRGAAPPGPPPF